MLALVLAVPAAGMAVSRGFDGLYGQDAYAYFDYGARSVRDSLLRLEPLQPFFWPPGYPLLVALTSLLVGAVPVAGQAVSLLMGALVPVCTALLAHELLPRDATIPVMAGVMVALCGQLWQSSIVVMADTTGLALATFGALALARYSHRHRPGWLLAASAALAYAVLARWIYGLVAIPFAAFAVVTGPRQPRQALTHTLAALAPAAALLLPVLGPPLVGVLSHPADPAPFAGNLQVYSWSPLNALSRDFLTADGHLSYALPNGLYYAIAPGNPALLGPLLAPWALLGAWAAVRQWYTPAHLLVLGWLIIVYAFHAGAPWQNFRFTLAYLPPLAILAATGLASARASLGRRPGLVVAVCAALGLVASAVGGVRLVQGFIDRKEDDLALVRWAVEQTDPGARILSFGPTLTFRHYTDVPIFDLFDVTPADLPSVVSNPGPTYVLIEEQSIEQQWLGQAPERNVTRLRADPGLTPIGQRGTYTLFRVGPDRVSESEHV